MGRAADRFVALSYFGIDRWLLVAMGALLFAAGAVMILAAARLLPVSYTHLTLPTKA